MDIKDFLQLVTPDGLRCIAMKAEKGFIQMPATTVDDAVRLAEWVDGQEKDAYFALATFKEEFKNENGKRRVQRKRKNVSHLKALWVDIDYKDCQPSTQAGGLAALQSFLAKTDFPKPTAMVSSGNGLHVYWPLSSPVGLAEWLQVAEAFKDLCQKGGLPADHACTADAARVLRPLGTHNYKDAGNPKPVVWVGGSGECYGLDELLSWFDDRGHLGRRSNEDVQEVPAHLRKAIEQGSGSEYTAGAGGRPQDSRAVFKRCGVLRHILKTGGKDQDEPEWNATMMLLAHLDDGAKYVHPMSKGHPGYDPDDTMEKWQQKVEAVEDGSGPTLCSTFENYHEDICQACPFHKSKKVKTPKSLAYMDDPTPAPHKNPFINASQFSNTKTKMPRNWRVGGNNDCIERKIWNEETKQYEWEPVITSVWTLQKVQRSLQSDEFNLKVRNLRGASDRKFDIASFQLGSNPDFAKTIAKYGCPVVNANEFKNLRDLMGTWLNEMREQAKVEDVTGQLGWIIDDSEGSEGDVLGFASGDTAYYLNGDQRTDVVTATGKYKGIADSFKPRGSDAPWREAAQAIVEQGCDHIVTLMATAFAGPLMKFTDQPGAVVSVVSEDSAAGKSTGLRLAQAVWGNPRHAPATMDDTVTVIKNKLAYLQNITAFWDEVRGDEQKMQQVVQIAFQVTQGRDRERANSKAETIRADEWQIMLTACSNESLFDLAAEYQAMSNAGIYRFFEVSVDPNEYPTHDHEIMSLVAQLDLNYGHAGKVYAEYLTQNYEAIKDEVAAFRLMLEKKTELKGPERFWIAAIAAIVLGAKYAGKCGLVDINTKRLLDYLLNSLHKLRARAVVGKTRLSPRELVAAYAQQHQDGKVTVDWFPTEQGKPYRESILQGNHSSVRKVSYVEATELNKMMVSKSDFTTWLKKSKDLKWNKKLIGDFERDLEMDVRKCRLAVGTKFALPRSYCLIFDLNEVEETDDAE